MEEILENIKKYGIRNAAQTTVALQGRSPQWLDAKDMDANRFLPWHMSAMSMIMVRIYN